MSNRKLPTRSLANLCILVSVCAVASGVRAQPCLPTPSGLVSWWRGEGDAGDAVGAINGTLYNGTAFATGVVGQALSFDGIDDCVTNTTPGLTNILDSFSMEFWALPTAGRATTPETYTGIAGISNQRYAIYPENGGYGPVGAGVSVGTNGVSVFEHGAVYLSSLLVYDAPIVGWTHVAVVYENRQPKLYLNGVLVRTGLASTRNPYPSTGLGEAGSLNLNYGYYAGLLDEVSIYNRPLSATEIQSIYNAGSVGKCVPPRPPPPYFLAGPITNVANGHWYYLLPATNWVDADELGRNLGGHLATINDVAENEWVFTNFSTFGGVERTLWIGLNDTVQENIWQWISGQPAAYRNWAPGEPNNGGGFFPSEERVLIWNPSSGHPLGSWADAPSDQLHSAVIEVGPPETVILAGPITNSANGHWYYLLNFTNWPAAERIAASLGGHLATINDATENQWVFDTFGRFGGIERPLWIGLNDSAQEGTWTWVSGEPVTYLNWSPNEPNGGSSIFPDEDHVLMWYPSSGFPNGSWNDAPSNQLQYAVVELTPPPPLAIVSQPTNVTVYVGSNATFRVTAGGAAPFAYQWRFNGNDLPGKTSSVLSLTNVQFSNAGPYSVVVSNAGGVIVSSNAVLTVNPLPECAPVHDGLVSWWRGENDLADSWDGNNGTATPRGIGFTTGKVGRAISIQFENGILVADSASLRLTNTLTLEAWVNPSNQLSAGLIPIISKFENPGLPSDGNQSAYLLGLTNRGLVSFMVSATGSARTNTTLLTSQPLPENRWSLVVATYDGTELRIYINGKLAAQTNYSDSIFPGTASLGLGTIPSGSPSGNFRGLLDEISIYKRALTAGEIEAIYNADLVGKCITGPIIIAQPESQAIPLGEDVKFTATVVGIKPITYRWRFNGNILPNFVSTNYVPLVLQKLQTNHVGNYSLAVNNKFGSAISSNATLTLLPPPTCTGTPAGLISWWPGDGNLGDAMGTNNVAIFSPTLYATGKVDRAFSFNGASSRIQVNNSPSLNFGSNADFSIEMWIKAGASNSLYPNVPLLEKGASTTSRIGYSLSLNQGRLAFMMASPPLNATNVSSFISPGPDLRDAMFHHVAVSVNRTATNGGNIYVDSQLVLTFDPTPRKGSLVNEWLLYIGAPQNTISNSYFGGLIDEPAIYNRALSAEEILAIRQAGAAGKCKAKPSILVQPLPASQKATVGSNVTYSITASGTPLLRYQWLLGGVPIPGATNSSYNTTVLGRQEQPYSYSVRVTNLFGSITSSNALLTANRVPTVLPQYISLDEDTPTPIALIGRDIDRDPLTYSIVGLPAHGIVSGTGSNVVYTPSQNFNGQDSFTFKVNDGLVDSAATFVSLTVHPVNDAPVSQSQSVSLDEDTSLAITLTASDAESDLLTYSVLSSPSHGTLSGTPPNLTYQPNTNYFGPDGFTFKVTDGQFDSDPATININVLSIPDAPVAKVTVSPLAQFPGLTNLVVISPNNTNATVVLDGSLSTDVENDPLQYTWLEGTNVIAAGVLAANVLPVGSHAITLLVTDGTDVALDTVTVEVITPAQSVEILVAMVKEASLSKKREKELLASLREGAHAFQKNKLAQGIKRLTSFQDKVRKRIAPSDPVLADQLINAAQVIIDAF